MVGGASTAADVPPTEFSRIGPSDVEVEVEVEVDVDVDVDVELDVEVDVEVDVDVEHPVGAVCA